MNCFETARLLRQMIQNEKIDDLRIIACTAFLQESDERASIEAGMNDFYTKPVNSSVIKEKLQGLIWFENPILQDDEDDKILLSFCCCLSTKRSVLEFKS